MVTVEVADLGPGIPDMEKNVITGEVEERPTFHGGGLGLRLVDVIVRQSDGVVRFEENDPRGCIVMIQLQAA
jgi:K+-sensing histidine kinase KdpD